MEDSTVVIIGLGLMGCSLAGALREHCRTVIGVARREETIEIALRRSLIDQGTTDLATGVHQADVVVLATPVRVIMQQLTEIGRLLPKGCLLMDLGSTKAQIMTEMARLPNHVQPLGGHPMCGKEVSGIAEASLGLYQGCTFILTPLERTSTEALELGCSLVETIGADPVILDPQQQDYLTATISHLPYLIACALVATADATVSADPAVWRIVAGGYRDTSRVAGSNTDMMTDILVTNRGQILDALNMYRVQLRKLSRLVEEGSGEEIRNHLDTIRSQRKEMFP